MVSRSVLLITVGALIALAAPTTAGAVLLGPGSGLTATSAGTTITVTFTPAAVAAAKLRTGARLEADCDPVPPARALAFAADGEIAGATSSDDDNELEAEGRLGADGVATLTVQDGLNGKPALTGYDACELDTATAPDADGSYSSFTIGEIGLTDAGRAYADETERAIALRHALTAAQQTGGGYKAPAAVAGVTALAAPGDSVPAGTIGYWTDGHQALTTTTSAAGRRLLLADRGDLTLASNVLDQSDPFGISDLTGPDLFSALLGGIADGAGGRAAPKQRKDPERDGSRPRHLRSRNGVTPLPGLRATVAGHRLTLRFTGAAAASYRAIAGRKVRASCVPAVPRTLFPTFFQLFTAKTYAVASGVTRVPRRGGRVAVTLKGGAAPDICIVSDDGVTVGMVPATRAGRARIQDVQALQQLSAVARHLTFAAKGATAYRTTAAIVAADPKRLVALSGPTAAPPVGKVGVWTDGAQHGALAVRSASGTRYGYADEGDGVLASNVLSLYTGDGIAFLATLEIS
jgi:hypothetical protein